MKVRFNTADSVAKKRLIALIGDLTSAMPKYLGAPTMAYQIGDCQVDREGNLIIPDDLDATELLEALGENGYKGEIEGGPAAAVETSAEAETSHESETEISSGEERETEEEPVEEQTEGPIEEPVEEAPETEEPIHLSVSFPLSRHSGASIRNLVNLLYSRGPLVSKAVQGEFFAPQELVEALKADKTLHTASEQIARIHQLEEEKGVSLKGISFDDEKVTFTGFPETTDSDLLKAFQQLSAKMNAQAIEQGHIQPKVVDEENEKYSLRTWLVRIGMDGPDYKKTRNLLMTHLKGHTAFKTPADAERWKARQAELKEQRKAQQKEAEECLE